MSAPPLVDRESLHSRIAALYDQLDLQEAVVRNYHSLKEAFQDQKLQIDRLQIEVRSYVEIAPRLAAYIQERYIRL